jgi:predicted short-subunit dehydrogenase-like oxidoreductase (DUF2520 family)
MLRVSFIGAGNVATRMAAGFRQAGAEVVQICSRSGNEPIAQLRPDAADLIVVSVSDDALPQVLAEVPSVGNHAVWVHTAGSVAIDVFSAEKFPRRGVIYPLQTLSKNYEVDWRKVPLFIEGSSAEVTRTVAQAAALLSASVTPLDSAHRRELHASAVLGCNLVMYLWSLAEGVMTRAGLDFELLRPLLEMTLERTRAMKPTDAMTGPARRGDLTTITKHMASLPPEVAETYGFLSQQILKLYHPELCRK